MTVFGQGNTSIFAPAGTPAHSTLELSLLVLGVAGGIFVVVAGLLTYALIRYRQRATDPDREPAQVYGSNQHRAFLDRDSCSGCGDPVP